LSATRAGLEVYTAPFPGPNSGIEERWMELEGARMRYLRAGSGPALILLHGLLGYSFSWRFTMQALAGYATVYAPDMMGAGFSDRPAGIDHSMRGTARRMLCFLENLGVRSFDLLGTSHGGAVAMMMAAECAGDGLGVKKQTLGKQILGKLMLVAPVNPFSPHGKRLAPFIGSDLGAAWFRMLLPQMRFFYAYWHARMYGDRGRIPPDSLEGYMAPLAKPGLFEHALGIVRTWSRDLHELRDTLPKLAGVRTLLMWGSQDSAVYASSAVQLAKYFPDSETIIFPGIGHLPYEECPEEFNRALIEFLTTDHASV
jgi:pimeloyl-ACP methyl ester carboxylesterase